MLEMTADDFRQVVDIDLDGHFIMSNILRLVVHIHDGGYALLFFFIVEVKMRPATSEDHESACQTGLFTILDLEWQHFF